MTCVTSGLVGQKRRGECECDWHGGLAGDNQVSRSGRIDDHDSVRK